MGRRMADYERRKHHERRKRRKRYRQESQKNIDHLKSFPSDTWMDWLEQAYHSNYEVIQELRYALTILQDHISNWPEMQQRVLTVEDARQLDICRLCKQLRSAPFVLNYGAEFAHSTCLECEEVIKDLREQAAKCEGCGGAGLIYVGYGTLIKPCPACKHLIKQIEDLQNAH